jgi:rod shape-determining protein MreC
MSASSASYGRLLGVSTLLFFLSLFLTAYSSRNPSVGNVGYRLVAEIMRPFQALNRSVTSSVTGVWSEYISLRGVRKENLELQERVRALEARNAALLEFEFDNRSLRELLLIRGEQKLSGSVARVTGYDPSGWQRAIVIDVGSADGVSVGLPVVAGAGLVGQVTSVSRSSARVLLITDPLSGVDALIQDTRARGIIEGNGGDGCIWKFVVREEQVRIGDRIVTSGLDGVYARGLPIGTVTSVVSRPDSMFHEVIVRPVVDMEKLESVFVVHSGQGAP